MNNTFGLKLSRKRAETEELHQSQGHDHKNVRLAGFHEACTQVPPAHPWTVDHLSEQVNHKQDGWNRNRHWSQVCVKPEVLSSNHNRRIHKAGGEEEPRIKRGCKTTVGRFFHRICDDRRSLKRVQRPAESSDTWDTPLAFIRELPQSSSDLGPLFWFSGYASAPFRWHYSGGSHMLRLPPSPLTTGSLNLTSILPWDLWAERSTCGLSRLVNSLVYF